MKEPRLYKTKIIQPNIYKKKIYYQEKVDPYNLFHNWSIGSETELHLKLYHKKGMWIESTDACRSVRQLFYKSENKKLVKILGELYPEVML